jgi:hypothetical protein
MPDLPGRERWNPEFEAALITGRACCLCGRGLTPEDRQPHGGFYVCKGGCLPVCTCGHDTGWHEDFREKAARPCVKRECTCSAFETAPARVLP